MANHEISLMNANFRPDSSGNIYESTLEQELTLGTATMDVTPAWVMEAPSGSDIGFYGAFTIPQNYVGTPVLVIRGVLAQGANILAFGFQQTGGLADNAAMDVAYEAQDIASETITHSAEDLYEQTITITPGSAYSTGDTVFFFFFRDDSVDTQTGDFLLTDLSFRYADA